MKVEINKKGQLIINGENEKEIAMLNKWCNDNLNKCTGQFLADHLYDEFQINNHCNAEILAFNKGMI